MRKNISLSIIIPLCLFLSVSCSTPEEKKERHYLKALHYIKEDDNKSAILELLNVIQIDAKYAEAHYQLGLIYLEEGDPKNAFKELIRAADLDHAHLDANLKAAEFYLLSRQKEESRKLVERILGNDPQHKNALALLANLELIEGNFDKAMTAIDAIGTDVDGSDRLLNIKGRIFTAQQQWDTAEATFKKAIKVGGDNITNYQVLLSFFQSRKEVAKALGLLGEMTTKFPNNPDTHLVIANFYRTEGNKDKVESELLKVIEIAPNQAKFRLMLADFYRNLNNQDKVLETLLKASKDISENQDIEAALATVYFEKGELPSARELLDKMIAKNPRHTGTRLLQARLMLKDRKSLEGIDSLLSLSKDFPTWSDPYFYLGLAHFNLGKMELAQQAVTAAIQKNKNNNRYHTLMAEIFHLQGDFESSKKEAAIALKLNPMNFRAALILSRSLLGLKDYESAIKLLVDMQKQVPENPEILGSLGLAYLGAGALEQGEKTLFNLLEVSPGNNRAVAILTSLKYQSNLTDAETFIESQIEISPDNSGLYMLLGNIHAKQKKNDAALAAYERAQELAPANIEAYIAAGRLLVILGRKEEAMAKYQAMIVQQPDSVVGHMGIATLLDADGKNEEAMEQYKKILTIKPAYAPAANNLAWHFASLPNGDLGEALRLAMLAKQAFPDEPHIADTLGWVHYKRKSYSLAIPQFEMALSGRPDDPVISYHLALALSEDGQKEKAVEVLERVVEKSGEFVDKEKVVELLEELKKG